MKYLLFILSFLLIGWSFSQSKRICTFNKDGEFQNSHEIQKTDSFREIIYSDILLPTINDSVVRMDGSVVSGDMCQKIELGWFSEIYHLLNYSAWLESDVVQVETWKSTKTKFPYILVTLLVIFFLVAFFLQRYRFLKSKIYGDPKKITGYLLWFFGAFGCILWIYFGLTKVYFDSYQTQILFILAIVFSLVFGVSLLSHFFPRGNKQRNIFVLASCSLFILGLPVGVYSMIGLLLGIGIAMLVERKWGILYSENSES